ncbi:copper-translocating P-type ATPase [Leuconostocaceae bacterium ESL0723]|nr:copper-translocating P-type ATPase [Leuconostocaceae bacterium ESL0723]
MDMNHSGDHDMGGMDMDQHGGHDMSGMDMGHDMGGMHGMHGMAGMAGMNMGDMRRRFWWSLSLMVIIVIITPFMGMILPFTITFPGSQWVTAVLSIALYLIGTKPFFDGAVSELKSHKPAMMSLISMGLLVTFWYSIYALLANAFLGAHVMDYFWEFATLTVIMLLGHLIEMSATMRAGDATAELRKLMPDTAHVKHGDTFMDMPASQLENGMVVQVQAGESFPADGEIQSGQTQVDESLMTGESKLISKKVGDPVIGGSINGDGTVLVKLNKVGNQSFVGQLQATLLASQTSKSVVETLASRVASWLFWVALVFAIGALIIWTPINGFSYAINIAVTTLVIACPHALGLAVPMVIQRTKAIAAKDGILIKNNQAVLSSSKTIKYALMDKTGTLTNGNFSVQDLTTYQDFDRNQVLAIMSGLDQQSSHPLAQSILNYAKDQQVTPATAENVKALPGYGITGEIKDQDYALVSNKYLDEHHIDYQPLKSDATVSYLTDGRQVLAAIAQGDTIKDSAQAFIDSLKRDHIIPVLVTGDNQTTANRVAQQLSITEVKSQVSPQDKIKLVKEYQAKGPVMMIGDGINDAPALAQANLSVAIGAGTKVAQASADAVLISPSLTKISDLISLSRHASRKQVENLCWGAGYNIIAIPAAAGVFAFAGITLNPMIGAIVMSLSTVIVAVNAMLLRK